MSLSYAFNHSAEEVFELFTDPDFLVDRALALGELSAEVEIEDAGNKVTITMRREVVRELPKFLAKLFNPKQVLHVTETWQKIGEQYVCKSEFTIEGQPVNLKTSTVLKQTDTGCEYTISYNVKAKIPLIGGKVEKFIVSNCEEGTQKELEYTDAKLKEAATA